MAERNLTISDVIAALQEQNVQAPAGVVSMIPTQNDQEWQYTGQVEGRLTTPEQFGDVIIRAAGNSSFVRLKDVARIETGLRLNSVVAKFNNNASVAFGIQLTSDANAMDTVRGVQEIFSCKVGGRR